MRLTVKKLGDSYKLVYFKFQSGSCISEDYHGEKDSSSYDFKLDSNLCRARSAIREYGLCNPWEYFVTLTLDSQKQDRYSLRTFVRDLGVWIGNYNKKFGCKLKYLLIPEQHKDGAWHMHGFFHDVSPDSIVVNSHGYFDMPYYRERFGFISLSRIRDNQKCASYITKYVTKSTGEGIDKDKHLYYHSRGLERAEILGEYVIKSAPDGVWFNDFVGIQFLNDDDSLAQVLNSLEMLS